MPKFEQPFQATKTLRRSLFLSACLIGGGVGSGTIVASPAPVFTGAIGLKETFDNNVFMQRVGADADQESLVTAVQANIAVAWKISDSVALTASYAPELSVFHSASTETFVAHRVALGLKGKQPDFTWDTTHTLLGLDGDGKSPSFSGPGGAPALGGVPLRDRRDALVYRGAAKATVPVAFGFVRPLASLYNHDFRTEQRQQTGYQNYVDRADFAVGADLAYTLSETFTLISGYRHGWQRSARAPGVSIDYKNTYDRVLVGFESAIGSKIKLALLAGPDWRNFSSAPATFDAGATRFFGDFSATLSLTQADTIALVARSFEQPGYAGGSLYIDTTYEAVWRRVLSPEWSLAVTARALNWDFRDPVRRNEWWYAGVFALTYKPTKTVTLEASYSYDSIESRVPATEGREARRDQFSIGVRRTF